MAFGPGALVQLSGFGFTFLVALLCIATLRPPTTGGRAWLRGREILGESGHPEYYDEWVPAFNLQGLTVERVTARLQGAAALFDQAVAVNRSFVPFAFKLEAHLRPYFVETCRSMLAEGYPAEAVGWITPYLLTATTILLIDLRCPPFVERLDKRGAPQACQTEDNSSQTCYSLRFARERCSEFRDGVANGVGGTQAVG